MVKQHKALASIIVTVIFWGFSFISIKVSVAVIPPMSLGALRFALACVLLYILKRRFAPREVLEFRDIPYLIVTGLIGISAYFYFENNGVSLVTASEASIIIGAIPVLTMVVQGVIFTRNIAPRRWIGALLSMAGVWLVAGATIRISGSAKGYLFMLGAAVSWVSYGFLTQPLFSRHSRIYIVFWQSVFGFLGFLPFAFMELPRWGSLSPQVLIHVAYLGIFCSALGYHLYASALYILGIERCTVFINLIPVVTVIAGFFILGERLLKIQWLGAAIVLSGVYLATLEGKHEKSPVDGATKGR